jgi:glycosyltransferase involved in cell wall biosynthesis
LVSLAGGELVGLRDIGYGDQLRPWERLKVRAALWLATAVSAGSESLACLAQRALPQRRVLRLPLGVDTALFQPTPGKRNGSRVLHVGALTPVKDQHMLLHAFALLRRSHPSATLRIVGDGPLRARLEGICNNLGTAAAVTFVGAREHTHLVAEYQRATAFVVTSRHEAQCMVALEAAACGTPVVGTAVGVLPELGPTVAVGDAAGLATALPSAMLEQPGAARPVVETKYSLQVTVDGFRQCYARLAR